MKIHLISGFLGSGKTTAIQQACLMLMQQGIKTGVITNDQGIRLVDGELFKSLGIPCREVVNGCFCCNYHDLDTHIGSLIALNETDMIFAESVGSCTDIVATVLKPLLHFHAGTQVTVSVFADARLLQMIISGSGAFEESVRYIYLQQLKEAGIIVINKVDLVDAEQLAALKKAMHEQYGNKILLGQNSLSTASVQQWINALNGDASAASLPSLQIDYDRYAAGEAALGWVDQVFEIYSENNNARQQAENLVNNIYEKIDRQQYPIGHLKFLVNNNEKISFTSSGAPRIMLHQVPAPAATVLMNMRVQAAPEMLEALVADAIKDTADCKIVVQHQSAFQPGYPQPSYRMY